MKYSLGLCINGLAKMLMPPILSAIYILIILRTFLKNRKALRVNNFCESVQESSETYRNFFRASIDVLRIGVLFNQFKKTKTLQDRKIRCKDSRCSYQNTFLCFEIEYCSEFEFLSLVIVRVFKLCHNLS